MPFMTSEELGRLWRQAKPGEGIVPLVRDRAEPLAAIYPVEVATHFAAALTGNDFSVQSVVRKLAANKMVQLVRVRAEHENLYRSVNEPDDLKERRFQIADPK
jgi:molybdopterin-guanine dinucleotide biosynthesis protein A